MLVLTRKLNQEILIGENIKITVLKVKGNTVRLGIEAPREVRIVRSELPVEETTMGSAETTTNEAGNSVSENTNAQITVVFNDIVDREKEQTLQMPKRQDLTSQTRTVRYQDRTPAILTHSRLQQIAEKLKEKNKAR